MSSLSALPRDVPGVHPPFANYSHGVLVPPGHATLFLSGQLGITDLQEVPEDAGAQADVIFRSVAALLSELLLLLGCDFHDGLPSWAQQLALHGLRQQGNRRNEYGGGGAKSGLQCAQISDP